MNDSKLSVPIVGQILTYDLDNERCTGKVKGVLADGSLLIELQKIEFIRPRDRVVKLAECDSAEWND